MSKKIIGDELMKRILSVLLMLAVVFSCITACTTNEQQEEKNYEAIAFDAKQIDGKQQIEVKWEDPSYAIVDVTVKHGDQIVATASVEGQSAQRVKLDVYYGKHQVLVEAKKSENGEFVKFAEGTKEVTLSADEYIIAPISGSMPQLYFTLNMKEITKDYTIPSFVWLARPGSWNWDNLPENVYAMPNVDKAEVLKHDNYDKMVQYTDAYIEELYSINPNAKFNLYINDFNSYLYLKLLAGNGIPEENYYVTLLSDGGASYNAFNKAFNTEDENFDADAKYADMATKLTTLYTEVRNAKDYNPDGTFTVDTSTFNQYAYVCAREMDNVEWWILRPRDGVLCSPDKDFITRVLNDDKTEGIIEERNFANPLKEMTDDEKNSLKSLYNFNNEIFEAADTQNKKAMMILGSWAKPENEPDFESYVRFTKLYYGDEFVYYYKGHPNTPTINYPDKQEQLKELSLIDVESSINAELILFFYPDIYMCGYNSSTFMSVEKPEMACAMFNMKKDACTAEYKDLIGIYLSKIDGESEYASLCTEKEHTYFLVEYNDDTNTIGIYDDNAGTIKNFKAENGTFTEITK